MNVAGRQHLSYDAPRLTNAENGLHSQQPVTPKILSSLDGQVGHGDEGSNKFIRVAVTGA